MKEELDNLVSSESTAINKAAEDPLSAKKEGVTQETTKIQTEAAKDMLNTTMKTMRREAKSLVISAIRELAPLAMELGLAAICKKINAKPTQTKQ